jgi:hypothetical protein
MATAQIRRSHNSQHSQQAVHKKTGLEVMGGEDTDLDELMRAPRGLQVPMVPALTASGYATRRRGQSRVGLPAGARACGAALIAALLASCGGGGSDESAPAPRDTVRLTCDVSDQATGKPVAQANVTYQAGSTAFVTKTDADGSCRLDLPANEVAGVAYPAASVEKPGYEPQTILCRKLQGGDTCANNVEIIPLADNVSIPVGGGVVMHLGDDRFEGAVNSQFQKKTDGSQLVFVIDDWAAKLTAGYTKATVYLDAKGWQTSSCNNLIELAGDGGTVSLPGGNSPSDGYWAGGKQVPFEFSTSQVGALRAELRVIAGQCNGTTDLDDFEINRIRVYFS